MRHLKGIAKVLTVVMLVNLLVLGLGVTGSAAPEQTGGITWAPQWDQEIIDKAVAENPVSMNIGAGFVWKNTLKVSEAMYIMALAAYYDPEITATNGTLVADRLAQHLVNITEPGKEPSCRGSLGGWVDSPVAMSMVLAKKTPAVWNQLSKSEKDKLDFIMSVMAISNNYCQNYQNDPCSDLSQKYWWHKGWNPNHQEGGVGNMIAAYLYFGGADEVNKILTGFDYDTYVAKMTEYGYEDMKYFYETTGKELLENGGQDTNENGEKGNVAGVKIPFTYKVNSGPKAGQEIEYDPLELYSALVYAMYGKTVVSEYVNSAGEKVGYIMDGSTSPFEGLDGMGTEFDSMDANGIRTDAGYINSGWRNSVPTRATLMALGIWDSERMAEEEQRMYIGTEDFLFKISEEHGGYMGWQKGHASGPTTESAFDGQGFPYYKEVWDKFVKADYKMDAKVEASGKVSISFDSLSPYEESAKFMATVYDADGKLVDVTIKEAKIANGESSFDMSAASGDLVKLFRITDERGLEFVASNK